MPGEHDWLRRHRARRRPGRLLAPGRDERHHAWPTPWAATPGTAVGGVTPQPAGATAGRDPAVELNGTSGYVTVPDAAALRLADGPFSLEAWVNRPTLGARSRATRSRCSTRADGGYQVNIQNNVVYFDQAAVGTIARSTTAMGTGWHHIVVTKNGGAVHIYQDGAEVTGGRHQLRTLTDGSRPLVLGVRRGNTTAFLDGQLDEVAVYRSVLTPAQVAAHCAARLRDRLGTPRSIRLGLDGTSSGSTRRPAPPWPATRSTRSAGRERAADRRATACATRSGSPSGRARTSSGSATSAAPGRRSTASPTRRARCRNFGWPCYEGRPARAATTASTSTCASRCTRRGAGPSAAPYFTYDHALPGRQRRDLPNRERVVDRRASRSTRAAAIPASYNGGLFFADYSRDCIWVMPAGATAARSRARSRRSSRAPPTRSTSRSARAATSSTSTSTAGRSTGSPTPAATSRRPRSVGNPTSGAAPLDRRLRRHRVVATPRAAR